MTTKEEFKEKCKSCHKEYLVYLGYGDKNEEIIFVACDRCDGGLVEYARQNGKIPRT